MKQPKLKNLKLDERESGEIRKTIKRSNSVKITINIDAETLSKLRTIAEETGVPYQRLLNKLLKESLDGTDTITSRLDRLEKELKELKRKTAA